MMGLMQIQAEVNSFDPAVPKICYQFHTTVECLDNLMN